MISDSSVQFSALIDCGSTHCFVDSKFVQYHSLSAVSVFPPIELKLFDGTSNSVITQSLELPVLFPTGESMTVNFYVTPLDPSCSVVLGYNWLTRYNPLIDWVLGSIVFRPHLLDPSLPTMTPSARAASLPQQPTPVPDKPPTPSVSAPHISLIGAVPFMRACKLPGAQCYRIHLSDPSASARAVALSDDVPDLSSTSKKVHHPL